MLLTVAVFAANDDLTAADLTPAPVADESLTAANNNSSCSGSSCGQQSSGCSGSSCGGSSGCGGTTHRRCITKECVRNSVKYVYSTTYKMEDKTTYNEVMDEHTRDVIKQKEETKEVEIIEEKFRTEWRTQ